MRDLPEATCRQRPVETETERCVIAGEVPFIADGAFHKFFTLFAREIVLEVSENLLYNDVGFMVGEKLLILTEAQSSWTENIAVRILIYLMVTYQGYIRETKQNVYKSRKVRLPRPEIYVVYTGSRKERPETISLAEEFFGGQDDFLDALLLILMITRTTLRQ